jgi:ABC-type bacteriocin/lantibiotic exporter with double-glycine peptidase domain
VTCDAVALLNCLERFHQHPPLTEREVSRICGVTAEGSTTSDLVKAARYFGLTNATARVLTSGQLGQAKLPAIVSISALPTVHHATLLIKLDAERAYFLDPSCGFRDLPRGRFQEIWYGKPVLLE